MFSKYLIASLLIVAASCVSFNSAALETERKRLALVIGNSDYLMSPLQNPVNDATDIAKALDELGFEVILRTDATLKEMDTAISAFGRKLEKNSGVGLFYYAGHGIQSQGRNYLIPVAARLERESNLKYETIDVGRVLDEMAYAKNGLNIVILDACRDNPLSRSFRSGKRGLAKLDDTPSGLLLAYSTSPGHQAADGEGRNSPYTDGLLQAIKKTGRPVELVFKDVIKSVKQETRGQQIPWISSSVDGDFYFTPPAPTTKAPQGQVLLASNTNGESDSLSDNLWKFELLYWESLMNNPTPDKYRAYLKKYPNGHFAPIAKSELKILGAKQESTPAQGAGRTIESKKAASPQLSQANHPIPLITPAHLTEEEKQIYEEYKSVVNELIAAGNREKAHIYLKKMEQIDRNGKDLDGLRIRLQENVKLSSDEQQIYDEYVEVINEYLEITPLSEKQVKKIEVYLVKLEKLNPYGKEIADLQARLATSKQ
jgi:uncharacterized caspase-like protein